ncbi:hypothetical protein KDU71_15690 [Carboxylicivirga sediminis]|uniref:Uncharacterized protein n=1 Tax=Carboxylicivirga sediminis TaxID=2006564 RepID=A0A941IYZ5_9BACT|nr:hypothetical protein [Carboxylicivirga sediminis]MBR8537014.1 hypothetical protein [Carboxylicivirga sediminis]
MNWELIIWVYVSIAILSFLPVLTAILKKINLKPGGDSFSSCNHFSDRNKALLEAHYSRIQGTLLFWKNKSEWNKRFHYYTLIWSLPISILIPIITQTIESDSSKLFLTIISSHTAILVGFHRALKIENNFKAFRHGESEFYDLYRRLLDRPQSFGETEEKQIENYFIEAEKIRKYVRNAETDNFPMLDELKKNKPSS